jgi:tRNA(Arg) A34 adenosine deaminase TadA
MNQDLEHARYMRRAIELARRVPQFPFGAVLVVADSGAVVAEGWNRSAESPIWHGEVDAIHNCARARPGIDWSQLVLYTTAEPCPMCAAAIVWAGIPLVVYGTSLPFLQQCDWRQIDIRCEEVFRRTPFCQCRVLGGVLEPECNELYVRPGPPV